MTTEVRTEPVLHVSFYRVDAIRLERFACWNCAGGYRYGRRTIPPRKARPFGVHCFQEWYGWDTTCLRCGERWGDGEHIERPFEPGWRGRNIASARRQWRAHRDQPANPPRPVGLDALAEGE